MERPARVWCDRPKDGDEMSDPTYPENAFSQNDPNPEGDDVDPDFQADEPSDTGDTPADDDESVDDEDLNDLA